MEPLHNNPFGAVAKSKFQSLPCPSFNLSERRFGAHIRGFATAPSDNFASLFPTGLLQNLNFKACLVSVST